ncbi:MAG TPA: tetratricopeptide repeat protein [Nitrospirota bacterium]
MFRIASYSVVLLLCLCSLCYAGDPHKSAGVVFYQRGVEQAQKNDIPGAIVFFKQAIKADPAFAPAYNGLGMGLFVQKKYKEAEENLKKAVQADPRLVKAHYNLGNLYADRNRNEEAVAEFKKATELDPKFPSAYSGWGMVLVEMKKYDEAIEKLRIAAKLDPSPDAKTNEIIKKIEKMKAADKKPAGQ